MASNRASALLIALALSIPAGILILAEDAGANSGVIFSDDFDTADSLNFRPVWTYYGSPNDWNDTDFLFTGTDYWAKSDYNFYSSSDAHRSAWCAGIGAFSENGTWNRDAHCYDQNMSAYLRLKLNDPSIGFSGYESANMTFFYWADTDTLNDSLAVNCINASGVLTKLWNQSSNYSNGWQKVTVDLPMDSIFLEFNFTSDNRTMNGPKEGVYIDDVSISATDTQLPSSAVGALSAYYCDPVINVTYNASDLGGAGEKISVELWYEKDTSGNHLKFVTPGNPSGRWSNSPIPFNSSITGGDGHYEFYTIAVDTFENTEASPSKYSNTTIDTAPPWGAMICYGTKGANGWYISNVTVTLYVNKDLSGIANISYMIIGGPQKEFIWQDYNNSGVKLYLDGTHSVSFNMTDNATNHKIRNNSVLIDKSVPSAEARTAGIQGKNGWYISALKVSLIGTDDISGISSINYTVDSGDMKNYEDNFTISKSGFTNITYFSVDNAGNSGKNVAKTLSFKIDPGLPTSSMLGDRTAFTESDVSLAWQGSDNESGIDHFEISFDGATFSAVGNDTSVTKTLADGQHTFRVRAVDIAGNVGTETSNKFTIDTNVLSPGGPMGPWLDIAIIIPIVAVALYLFLRLRKKPSSPASSKPVDE